MPYKCFSIILFISSDHNQFAKLSVQRMFRGRDPIFSSSDFCEISLLSLEEIILEASKLLKFGGYFYVVNKEERLTDIICLCRKYNLEPKELKVIESISGANIIMVKAKKGGKSGLKISLD